MASALLFPRALLSNPESYLHFHMLKFSLVLKATWSGSSSDMTLFPANLSHILHPCVSSCVILDESLGHGRYNSSDQGHLPRSTTFSTCLSPLAGPWSMSHKDHINSELTPFQPLHVTNSYQQQHCWLCFPEHLKNFSLRR